jgi:membrane-bound metal-dependent hydrolase YbcI (DUF457 family)
MDGLSCALAAAALAEAGPRRRFGPAATFLVAVAATAPDLDVLAGLIDRDALVFGRRGVTHSLPVLAAIAAGLASLWGRWLPVVGFGRRFGLALAGTALHGLLDLLDATGFRPFAPFMDTAWRRGWLPPFDPWLWAMLGTGLVAGWIMPAWGVASARTALVVAGLYTLLCGGYHALAKAHLKESLTRIGVRAERLEAYARVLSPLTWTTVGWLGDRYYVAEIHALRGLEGRVKTYLRHPVPDRLRGPFVARYERWAHAPLVRPLDDSQGGGLAILDLRFLGRPDGLPYVARLGETAGGETRHAWLTRSLAPPIPDEEYELPKR